MSEPEWKKAQLDRAAAIEAELAGQTVLITRTTPVYKRGRIAYYKISGRCLGHAVSWHAERLIPMIDKGQSLTWATVRELRPFVDGKRLVKA